MTTDDYTTDDANRRHARENKPPVPRQNQEYVPPFSPPSSPIEDTAAELEVREQEGRLDPTHQATDNASDIDSQELYDEGLSGAAEASEPNAGNSVVGYDPEKDKRKHTRRKP